MDAIFSSFAAINWLEILFAVPALMIALTFHEFCHGLAATALGDNTPRLQGRLTLNPLRHMDAAGTVMLFLFKFGWAKPVQVNPLRFRVNRKLGMAIVALAGPLSNIVLAVLAAYGMNFIDSGVIPYNPYFYSFFYMLLVYNVCFAAFNILPFPPLDGSKVVAAILTASWADIMYRNTQLFMLLLVLFTVTGFVGQLMAPIVGWCYYLVNLLVI
ncbi:MAG: site-2 protease family protein [Firmicutes bacterium]|nr:site-2 protease family protein [Bacillota bacterium]